MLTMAEHERAWEAPFTPTRRALANVAQIATIAGVHRNTIYNWVRDNKVEWLRTPGGHIRVYVDTVLKRPPED